MAAETPQAGLPSYRDKHSLLKDAITAQKLNVLPPRIVIENSAVVANEATKPALDAKKDVSIRQLQNCGTRKVYWSVNSVPTAEMFHGILAGCSVQDDGLGSVKDFSNIVGAVYIFDAGGNPRVATYEALSPEAEISNQQT